MFVITSMPVGGAETLLANMLSRFDSSRIRPFVCCLKDKDELGEKISNDFQVYSNLIHSKFDVAVVHRLRALMKQERVDAIVTVGAGDKMFWGRLAAKYAGVPVILSALHSTGWPDGVGTLNRLLTRITTGFIAVAEAHGEHLIEHEGFPAERVYVIPNGIDTERFQFCPQSRAQWRSSLGIPESSPVVGIVAALRPEKNHALFVEAAGRVSQQLDDAHFVVVGDGPERREIETKIAGLGLSKKVHLAGCTHDIPGALSMMDLFALTSHNEASPVSILEAMSCQRPVVSSDVGSVKESVLDGRTGFLVPPADVESTVTRWTELLSNGERSRQFGESARQHVLATSSLDSMTGGYTELIESQFADANPFFFEGSESAVTSAREATNS